MRKFLSGRVSSFACAFRGTAFYLNSGVNVLIHLVATATVIILGFVYRPAAWEWVALIICIGMVLAAEAFNTAIETMVDFVEPNRNPKVGMIKDIAAGAVLITAMASFAVGLIIFLPRIVRSF